MAVNVWQGVQQGQQLVDNLFRQRDQMQAGRALATGDYGSAMRALGAGGDVQGVRQIQADQVQAQQRQRATQEEDTARQVAFTRQATAALRRAVTEGGDALATYDSMAPAFQQIGATPEQLQQYRQALAADPEGFLTNIERATAEAERKLQVVNFGSGRGATVVDTNTGEEVRRLTPDSQPINVDGVLLDPATFEVILDTRAPKYQTVTNSDGSTSVVAIDQPAPIRGRSQSSGDVGSILDGIIRREGGFVASDGRSGAPANFGINQRANPDIDVANLTEGQARQIYNDRYIKPILEAGVSGPGLEAVVDFGVNAGVGRALDFWRRSGGDIDQFNKLRLQHYRSLPDYDRNGRSWERRVAETTPGGRGGSEVPVSGGTRVVAQGANTGPQVTILSDAEKAELGITNDGTYQRDRQGRISLVSGTGPEKPEKFTEGQRSAAAFSYRTAQASNELRQLESQGIRTPSAQVLLGDGTLNTAIRSQTDRQFMQAARNWLAPILRKDTGAAVTDTEMVYYMDIYIPRPGDGPEVLAQKARARADAERALRAQAGRAYDEMFAGTPEATRQPRVRFALSPQQQAWVAQNGQAEEAGRTPRRAGSRENPRLINPANATQSYNNIPSGSYFLTPDGQLRQKR